MRSSLSVFDLDRTLVFTNSSFAFCKHLCARGFFSSSVFYKACGYYLWHQFLRLSLEKLHRKVFHSLLVGCSLPRLEAEAALFVDLHMQSMIYYPCFERLQKARQMGEYTAIFSASPDFLVRYIARKLQVDIWKASEYRVDKDCRLCDIQKVVGGVEKAAYVEELLQTLAVDRQRSTGYTDSHLDLPFLEVMGTSVVVNPDRILRRVALQHKWERI